MSKIIDSAGKGASLSATEYDSNVSTLAGKNQSVTAATHTITVSDQGETVEYNRATAIAVTLPLISSVSGSNIHTDDFTVVLKNIGAGIVTATCSGVDTFEDGSTAIILSQYEYAIIQTDSSITKWNIINSSDASKVDGLDASQFIRSDANDTATGDLTLSGTNTHSGANTHSGGDTFTGNVGLDGGWDINGTAVNATAAELNDLAGNAVDAADFTKLSQITATAAELNDLAGNAVDAADFTKLSQVTATSAELNITDGLTATTAELNKVDGGTSASAITAVGTDRVVYNDGGSMIQVALTTLSAYFRSVTETLTNKTIESSTINNDVTGNVTGDLTGNASTAIAFNSSRTFNATGGDVTGSVSSTNGNYTVNLQIGANKVGASEIAAGAVGNSEVANNTMRFSSEMLTSATQYTWSTALNTGAGVVIPRGVYMIYSISSNFQITHLINGTHRVIYTGGTGTGGACIASNGATQYSSSDGSTATGYAARVYV